MAADQLPAEVGEFVTYLDGLLARLDPSGGWCAVFWQRDPEGMRACLDGRDLPPWDVVEALLQDLAGQYGPGGAGPEAERARALHAAALAVYDARPGGRDALGDRLDVMLREQQYAAERQAALARHLTSATTPEQADALRLDLAWARDDHERAAARCAELRARMAHADRRERGAPPATWGDGDGLHGAGGPGSPAPAPQRSTQGSASTATDRYGTADLGAGWPGRQHPVARDVSWEVQANAVPAPAPPGPSRQHPVARDVSWEAPENAVPAPAPPGSSGRSGPGAYGTAAPESGWPGRQPPVNRGSSGKAPANAVPAPAPPGPSRQHPVARDVSWEAPANAVPAPAPPGSSGRSGPGAYGTAAPESGWPGRQPPVNRGSSGKAPANAAPAPARPGSSGRSGPGGPEAGRPDRQRQVNRGVLAEPDSGATPDALSAPAPGPAPKPRKRRRGSARFAGMVEEEAVPVVVPPAVVPTLPAPAPAPVATGRTPRGARFAGAGKEDVVERPVREGGAVGAVDLAEVGRTVDALARLRSEGRSGEAHALLAEVTSWEPGRFPLLAERLHLAGLDADWQTLLWEAASLPAGRLVAAADALVEAGRAGDGQQMLRQGVARPPGEVGEAVLGLAAERRHREVRVLLDAYVRARTPEEAARSAEPDPRRLVPLLLEAAQGVSDERRWDLVHALRVAGFAA
ncbi:hypothetical protein [Streptomyces massasporeus]|uniref:hypothetical protein n=1 Tax=Streptomyces massasporeus TaxID=67324 RepID=UPI0034074E40